MSTFSDPNDDRRTPVNNMIQKLLQLRLAILAKHTPVTRKTSGGYFVNQASEEELAYQIEGEAKMVTVNKLIAELELIAY